MRLLTPAGRLSHSLSQGWSMETVRSFLSQISLPVLVSAVTSAVVSLGSFLVGSRFAKERSDRGALRQLYQELRQNLVEMREAIERGRPKRWEEYPTSHDRYMPPIATLEHSGRLALIPEPLGRRLLDMEKRTLSAEWPYRKWLSETAVPTITSRFNNTVRNPTSSISGRPYSNLSIGKLGLHGVKDIEKMIDRIQSEKLGWGLDMALEKSRSHVLFAYEETMADGSIADLIRAVVSIVDSDADGRELRSKLLEIERELASEIKKLTARVNEPQPFWETIGRAFAELGKG